MSGFFILMDVVGEGHCGRLVDDAENCEAHDLSGFFGGLALGVVELLHATADIFHCGFFHAPENPGRDFLR